MAEETKDQVIEKKTPEANAEVAPKKDKPIEQKASTESLDEDDIDETVMLLNIMDQEIGGKGEISEIPEGLRGSIKYLVEKLVFIRDLFEDPLWKSILDDMADQKEDGKTPSVEVAIARNIPLEKIQTLAEGEDYEGVQTELASNLTAKTQAEEEDAEYEASFEESKQAGEQYATEMGYDEDEKNELFQLVLDIFKIMADGKLTVEEFRKVDKMRNYDKDVEDMRSQIQPEASKEVLPDKASVDAAIQSKPKAQPTKAQASPGLGSIGAYSNVGTDVTEVGKRKRK